MIECMWSWINLFTLWSQSIRPLFVWQEWKPRWGYKRANDDTQEWCIEVPDNAGLYATNRLPLTPVRIYIEISELHVCVIPYKSKNRTKCNHFCYLIYILCTFEINIKKNMLLLLHFNLKECFFIENTVFGF